MTGIGKPRRPLGRARPSLFLFILLAALPLAATGRLALSPYFDYSRSDNIYWNVNQVGDTILSPGLGIEYASGPWNFFLAADAKLYGQNDFLNSSMLSGGFSLIQVLSPRTSLFVSPDISLTRYKSELSFLDTASPGVVLGIKHALSSRLFSRLGLVLRYSDYLYEDSYDRTRLGAFLEGSAFLPSQTTLRLTAGLNSLHFPHLLAPVIEADGGEIQPFLRSPAYREGPGSQPARIDLTIPQPFLTARIAQGIGYRTGIAAEFMVRRNGRQLQGIQALAASEWALEQTDDDFFWQGWRFSLGFKTEAVLSLEISLDLAWVDKEYPGIEALDLDGVPVQPLAFRADTLKQAALRAAKRFGAMELSLSAVLRDNASNDLYFQYDFYTISAGVEIAL